jgi:basic membrane protein A
MKKLLMTVLVLMTGVAFTFASGNSEKTVKNETGAQVFKVGLIAQTFGTQSYNDDVKDGLDAIGEKYGLETIALEVPEVIDSANAIRTLISQDCNIMIIPSSNFEDGMIELAYENPEVKFIYLGDPLSGYSNIMSVAYSENEGAFIIGVLAGLMTKTNNVGAVLAIEGDFVQEKYHYGFKAGVESVNPDCTVQIGYTNSYADINKGNEMAKAMFYKDADFIGSYAGACNLGVFNAAKKAGDDKYAFGAAKGQFEQLPSKILASLVKPIDLALLSVVGNYINDGSFDTDKPVNFGLSNQGVVIKFNDLNDELVAMVPTEVMDSINSYTQKIGSGEIKAPNSLEEYNAFKL